MHTRSFLRLLSRGSAASGLAFVLWGLLLPPAIWATPTPTAVDTFRVVFSSQGQSYDYQRADDGSMVWFGSNGTQGRIDPSAVESVEILESTEVDGQINVKVAVPDGLGDALVFTFGGTRLAHEPGASGFLTSPSGNTLPMQMSFGGGSGGDGDGDGHWMFAVVAGLSVLGCWGHAVLTDCAADCGNACEGNLASSSEGLCGMCDCVCK